MIRNACIHLNGEQPLLADLFEVPGADDVSLRCTNLRSMNGKRPVFADDSASIFFFPMIHIRFLEIPPGAVGEGDPRGTSGSGEPRQLGVAVLTAGGASPAEPEEDLEIDEDFLRRVREA